MHPADVRPEHLSVQPGSGSPQADERHGAGREQLRAERHRSGFQVPAGLAQQLRRGSPAAGRHYGDRRVPLQQGRQRRLLLSTPTCRPRRSAFTGVDNRPALDGEPDQQHVAQHHHQRSGDEEPEYRLCVEPVGKPLQDARTTDCPSEVPTATVRPRTQSIPGPRPSRRSPTTRSRTTRTIQVSAAPPTRRVIACSCRASYSRSYFELRHDHGVRVLGGTPVAAELHDEDELRLQRRHEQRRILRERPDLHPARYVRDELRRSSRSRNGRMFTAAEQAAAFEAYIQQDQLSEQAPRPVRRA